jgi:hypothetical protein
VNGWRHQEDSRLWDSTPAFGQWIAEIVDDGRAAKQERARLMQRIYGTVDRWRRTYGLPIKSMAEIAHLPFPLRGYVSERSAIRDQIAFMERVCEEWYKVCSMLSCCHP